MAGGPWKIGVEKNVMWTFPQLKQRILEDIEKSFLDGYIDDPVHLKGVPVASVFETKDNLAPMVWKEA